MSLSDVFGVDSDYVESQTIEAVSLTQESRVGVLIPHQSSIIESVAAYQAQKDLELSLWNISAFEAENNNAAWEMFLGALRDKIGGDQAAKNVQLLPIPQDASWSNPSTGLFTALRVLADTIPQWSAEYRPTSLRITQGYSLFLRNLAIPLPNPEDQKAAEKAQKKFTKASEEYDNLNFEHFTKWVEFNTAQQQIPEDRRVPYETWFSKTYGPRLAQQNEIKNLLQQEFVHWINKAGGGYTLVAQAYEAFNNSAFEIQNVLTPSGAKAALKSYNITPDLGQFISDSQQIPADRPPAFEFSINNTSYRYNFEESRWGARASYFGGFFGGARGGGSRTSVDTSRTDFNLSFSCKNIQIFTITPGEWFNGTVVKAFRDGPWIEDGPVANGSARLWGAEGVLSLIPVQVVVVFRPKISVKLSQSEYSIVQSSFSAGGGFSIGPFGFGASYGRSSQAVTFDSNSNTVTAEDPTDSPQIAAILTTALPNFD
jgi:hypothetical protein